MINNDVTIDIKMACHVIFYYFGCKLTLITHPCCYNQVFELKILKSIFKILLQFVYMQILVRPNIF